MQTTTNPVERQATQPQFIATATPTNEAAWTQYHIIRRNGAVVNFEPSKIGIAMTKAFLAVNGGQGAASARVRELVEQLTTQAVNALVRRLPKGAAGAGSSYIRDQRGLPGLGKSLRGDDSCFLGVEKLSYRWVDGRRGWSCRRSPAAGWGAHSAPPPAEGARRPAHPQRPASLVFGPWAATGVLLAFLPAARCPPEHLGLPLSQGRPQRPWLSIRKSNRAAFERVGKDVGGGRHRASGGGRRSRLFSAWLRCSTSVAHWRSAPGSAILLRAPV